MSKRSDPKSELVAAATDLDAELQRFEEGVAAFTRLQLSSKKNLDRAGKMLEELATSEQSMGTQIQALVQAIAGTRDRQLERVAVIREKAEQLKNRSIEFRDLILQFEALGTGASELNTKLQQPAPAVVDVADDVAALAGRAEQLVAVSKDKGFDDVAHLADGLRQQLQALQHKLAAGKASH